MGTRSRTRGYEWNVTLEMGEKGKSTAFLQFGVKLSVKEHFGSASQ
jgi:hypothetical protein